MRPAHRQSLSSMKMENREFTNRSAANNSMTPLRFFLQKSMLSTDTESNEDDDEKTPVGIRARSQLTVPESHYLHRPCRQGTGMACCVHSSGRARHLPFLPMYGGARDCRGASPTLRRHDSGSGVSRRLHALSFTNLLTTDLDPCPITHVRWRGEGTHAERVRRCVHAEKPGVSALCSRG